MLSLAFDFHRMRVCALFLLVALLVTACQQGVVDNKPPAASSSGFVEESGDPTSTASTRLATIENETSTPIATATPILEPTPTDEWNGYSTEEQAMITALTEGAAVGIESWGGMPVALDMEGHAVAVQTDGNWQRVVGGFVAVAGVLHSVDGEAQVLVATEEHLFAGESVGEQGGRAVIVNGDGVAMRAYDPEAGEWVVAEAVAERANEALAIFGMDYGDDLSVQLREGHYALRKDGKTVAQTVVFGPKGEEQMFWVPAEVVKDDGSLRVRLEQGRLVWDRGGYGEIPDTLWYETDENGNLISRVDTRDLERGVYLQLVEEELKDAHHVIDGYPEGYGEEGRNSMNLFFSNDFRRSYLDRDDFPTDIAVEFLVNEAEASDRFDEYLNRGITVRNPISGKNETVVLNNETKVIIISYGQRELSEMWSLLT
ncbi:MAG: hypothetical protein M9918_04190, partial [Anaerolineae bacterium]|nr:hypothetical protein [Anaerolineae bacterium]